MLKKRTDFLEDEELLLIKGAINNDRYSQNCLYKKYSSKMMAVCFRYSKNREDAEDILNDGFMKVFAKIKTYKNEGSFEGWIRRIMVNTAIEKLRTKSNLYQVISIEDIRINHIADSDTISEINAKELINLIQKLPPTYQLVFNLYAFEGFKHKEIAEKLGISEGTSKSNLSGARAWLKKGLEKLSAIRNVVNE